jgi:hypothetical protein
MMLLPPVKKVQLGFRYADALRGIDGLAVMVQGHLVRIPSTGSPVAAEVLKRIAELYVFEKRIHRRSSDDRLAECDTHSRPLVNTPKYWLDNKTIERANRPVALGHKNYFFAGSDGGAERWAVIASLIATDKLKYFESYT